jgi:DNA-binding transcriptional LysR family regulator
MEMRHLRYFIALAEHGNFRRAAERLAMAQPPLSRQIRALEREVGCRLLVRGRRGVELTAAGRAFLERARITLQEAQRAVDHAQVASPEHADRLVLGCDAAAELAFVARALAALARSHASLQVELSRQSLDESLRALRRGATQAVVMALPCATTDEEIVVEAIGSSSLCLAVATGHPFAGPRPVSWSRLAAAPFVLFEREAAPVLFDAIIGTCQEAGVALHVRHRASDPSVALELVAAGLGVTVVPAGWQSPRSFGVTCRPLRPPHVEIPFGIAYRRGAEGRAVKRFVAAARAVLSARVPSPRVRGRSPDEAAS